jgi:NADPH2:quinone reductase
MKAWRVHDFGEPADVLRREDVAVPTPDELANMGMDLGGWKPLDPGEEVFNDWAILDVAVAGLALPDVTMARGTYPVTVRRPYTSGQEAVGTVTSASSNHQNLIGKRVVAVTVQPYGSFAPTAVGTATVYEVPGSLGDEEAAGFLIPAHTAYHAVTRRGKVSAGETALVLGAAGGLGSAMVQLCIAAGARVFAVVGGKEKVAFCERLGAVGIDHRDGDFVEAVKARNGGKGVDVVLDPVQGDAGAHASDALVVDGRHVICGHAGGLKPWDPHFYLYNRTLVGTTLGGYSRQRMREIRDETRAALDDLLAAGKFRPQVSEVIGFDEIPAALTRISERRSLGRVVARIN